VLPGHRGQLAALGPRVNRVVPALPDLPVPRGRLVSKAALESRGRRVFRDPRVHPVSLVLRDLKALRAHRELRDRLGQPDLLELKGNRVRRV
jgi:hypothetical protein